MNYNTLLRSHFAGCRLLHQGHDPHRNRPAKYFHIPGVFHIIGYSDATDSFIVPVNTFTPRGAVMGLEAIQSGQDFHYIAEPLPVVARRGRPSFNDDDAGPAVANGRRRF